MEKFDFNKVLWFPSSRVTVTDVMGFNFKYKPCQIEFKRKIAECDSQTLKQVKKLLNELVVKIKKAPVGSLVQNNYLKIYNNILQKFNRYVVEKRTSFINEPLMLNNQVFKYHRTVSEPKKVENEQVEKVSLYERLKSINDEGRVFTDEDRIKDKNLNIYNAKSLNLINNASLKVAPQKRCKINFQKSKIAEFSKDKYFKVKQFLQSTKNSLMENLTVDNGATIKVR